MRPLTDDEVDLVKKNLPLATYYLKRRRCQDQATWEDLRAAAYLGLCRAVQTYKPAQGQLSTYAKYWITRYIQQEIHALSLVRVPSYHYDRGTDARRALSQRKNANAAKAATHWHSLRDCEPLEAKLPRRPGKHAKAIAAAMEKLSSEQRTIINRIVMHGDRICEVIADTGIKRERLKRLKHNALAHLACELAELAPKQKD